MSPPLVNDLPVTDAVSPAIAVPWHNRSRARSTPTMDIPKKVRVKGALFGVQCDRPPSSGIPSFWYPEWHAIHDKDARITESTDDHDRDNTLDDWSDVDIVDGNMTSHFSEIINHNEQHHQATPPALADLYYTAPTDVTVSSNRRQQLREAGRRAADRYLFSSFLGETEAQQEARLYRTIYEETKHLFPQHSNIFFSSHTHEG